MQRLGIPGTLITCVGVGVSGKNALRQQTFGRRPPYMGGLYNDYNRG